MNDLLHKHFFTKSISEISYLNTAGGLTVFFCQQLGLLGFSTFILNDKFRLLGTNGCDDEWSFSICKSKAQNLDIFFEFIIFTKRESVLDKIKTQTADNSCQ